MSLPIEEYPNEWKGMTRGQCKYIYSVIEVALSEDVKELLCMPRKVDDMEPSLHNCAAFLRNMADKMSGEQ